MEAIGAIRSMEVQATEAAVATGNHGLSRPRDRADEQDSRTSEETKQDSAQVQTKVQEKIRRIAQVMDDYVRSTQRSLKIQVHPGTGDFMVKVISEEDGRTIREIPPEEVLNLAAKMEEMMGLLFNEKV
ncbi:MAG: flagellar protein FlaG [Thermodesulfobacteriota bacterium]